MKQKNLKKVTYLDYKDLAKLSKTYGQSFFILDAVKFRKNYIRFLKAFKSHYPKICIGYSYKTNYTPSKNPIYNIENAILHYARPIKWHY
jgi:diaminopimelate decarboxylase